MISFYFDVSLHNLAKNRNKQQHKKQFANNAWDEMIINLATGKRVWFDNLCLVEYEVSQYSIFRLAEGNSKMFLHLLKEKQKQRKNITDMQGKKV